MKVSRLRTIADMKEKNSNVVNNNAVDVQKDKLISFEFDNNKFYLAMREQVLVFNEKMNLLYTIDYDMLEKSTMPLFVKVNEIVTALSFKTEKLMFRISIKRNGKYEKLSFTNRFDANFIFKKLKRVASRGGENIEEVFLEKNDVVLDSFVPAYQKNRMTMAKNPANIDKTIHNDEEKLDLVSTLARVEDAVESIISSKMSDMSASVNAESIDKCIELLNRAKTQL